MQFCFYSVGWCRRGLLIIVCLLSAQLIAPAAGEVDTTPVPLSTQDSMPMDAKADRLNYDRTTGWVEGIGHVVITKGDEQLRADFVRVNVNTEDAEAVGDVVLLKLAQPSTNAASTNAVLVVTNLNRAAVQYVTVWSGNKLKYNFKTKRGSAANMTYNVLPFYVKAKSAQQVGQREYSFTEATITTCTNAYPNYHYHVRAANANIIQKDSLKARHTVFYFCGIPMIYFPYWQKNLNDDCGFRFYPGYNSRMGAFLLTLYRYRLNPYLKSTTHLDYRQKRGLAYGQDLEWKSLGTNTWKGILSGYYLNDDDPTDDGDREIDEVDPARYRANFKHEQAFSDRDYMLSQAQYLSDPYLNMDFFEDEYREANQPDNYLVYTHRGDRYTGNLTFRSRLNDFYENVGRLPEVSLDFMRQEIGSSVFYYEGQTAASFLQKSYQKGDTNNEDYSVFRLDSHNMIYYPGRYFGFLNIMPRAGYRGTYYSETMVQTTSVTTGITTIANSTVDASGRTNITYTSTLTTNRQTITTAEAAKLRNRFELGTEASFRAFRTWDDEFGGWRHVVEPYANYTFVPEPNLLPDNLYQFDSVDTFGKEHWVRLGLRNKLQTKVDGSPFDLVDVDVYTRYLFEQGDRSTAIDNVYFEAKTWPAQGVILFFDGMYDTEESVLSTFNTRLGVSSSDFYSIMLEHRYTYDGGNFLNTMVSLSPNRNWTFEVYGRYEFESSRLEEVWGYISKKTDCLTLRTGAGLMPGYTTSSGSEKEDEVRFVVELWLNAFPEMAMGRHRN
ncbi:MAG: hypothetical protein A2283_20165 [Lentisphaerae bacterium RIFOXYA12_FULL_48_11]|nr:MAG: hypothetical protein A2283_20165 [Lentisphaerae bacterium RIFOXYA12_FULL_48_11]